MSLFFTSEFHWNHFNIIRYAGRPFKDVKEMNSTIIRKFNERVKENDLVFFHGDLAFKSGTGRGEGEPQKPQELLKRLNCKNIVFIEGNHDCFSLDTKILTPCGYKFYYELKIGDLVATINLPKKTVEYQPLQDIIFQTHPFVYHFKNKQIDAIISENHMHYIIPESCIRNRKSKWIWEKQSTKNILNKWAFWIPKACQSKNQTYNISNDWLSLFAWIHTDGRVQYYKNKISSIYIYQSKKYNITIIETLLKKLKINFTHIIRNRKIEYIMGKKIHTVLPQHEFRLGTKESKKIQEILQLTNKFPAWINSLSDVQIQFLIQELIKRDGSYTSSNSIQLWGQKDILERWMGIFATHNQSSNLIQDKRGHYYLCIHQHLFKYFPTIKIKKKDIEKTCCENTMWDITVKNHIIFAERNGKSFITSNSNGKNGFKTPIQSVQIKYGGYLINLVHNPEHANFDYPINIVGHVHERWFCKRFFKNGKQTDCINVSVEQNNYYPFTWDEIYSRYMQWRKNEDAKIN